MARNWINEMILKNNFLFATMPTKSGVDVFPIHKGGWSLGSDDLWETFKNVIADKCEEAKNDLQRNGDSKR